MADRPHNSTGTRPSWDDYFMQIAFLVAQRSTCLRRQVGALLVANRRILATGYNGAPQGLPHCEELGGCLREQMGIPAGERQELCRALHAEQNAIIQAAVHGVGLQDVTAYSTTQPCVTCAKMLINANVKRIVFAGDYPDPLARQMLADAGVALEQWEPPHPPTPLSLQERGEEKSQAAAALPLQERGGERPHPPAEASSAEGGGSRIAPSEAGTASAARATSHDPPSTISEAQP